MKILPLLIFSTVLFLNACSTQTPRPVPPVDWATLEARVNELGEPAVVDGPFQHRGETKIGLDLWNLSLQQELALKRANGNTTRLRDYFLDFLDALHEAYLPECTAWLRLRGVPCNDGE